MSPEKARFRSILTTRQRLAIKSKGDKCGSVYRHAFELKCMMPQGHRGVHAAECETVGGKVSAKWPQLADKGETE